MASGIKGKPLARHAVIHDPQPHRTPRRQLQCLQPGAHLLFERLSGGGILFEVAWARDPQPRAGFSQPFVDRRQGGGDPMLPGQPLRDLRRGAPGGLAQPGGQLRPRLCGEQPLCAGVLRAPVAQQQFHAAFAEPPKPFLNRGARAPHRRRDLLQVLPAHQAELHGHQPFPPPARRLLFKLLLQ